MLSETTTLTNSMSRRARIVVPDLAHHVVQRGNNGNRVFFGPKDRALLLRILADNAEDYGVSFLSYCLMDNHIHLVVVPHAPDSLAGLFRCSFTKYSLYINRRLDRSGHLWQSRYFSSPMDRAYLYNAVRYVERNPVRAGLVDRPGDYPWSSAGFHLGIRGKDPIVECSPELDSSVGDWEEHLSRPTAAEELDRIRKTTFASKPCGRESFLNRLAEHYGNEVFLRRRGRPSEATG